MMLKVRWHLPLHVEFAGVLLLKLRLRWYSTLPQMVFLKNKFRIGVNMGIKFIYLFTVVISIATASAPVPALLTFACGAICGIVSVLYILE